MIHLHFHDLFEEEKHPRAHGKFAPKGGGSSGLELASNTVAKIGSKIGSKLASMAHNYTKEDYEALSRGDHLPGSAPRKNMANRILGSIKDIIKNHLHEEAHMVKHTLGAANSLRKGLMPSADQKTALRRLTTRALMVGTSVALGEPTGTVGHIVLSYGEDLAHHLMLEHGAKFSASAMRSAFRARRNKRSGIAGGEGDAAFNDASEDEKFLEQYLKELAHLVANKPIPDAHINEVLQRRKAKTKGNGDRLPTLFGGLLRGKSKDAGTSAGVKKAWIKRHAHEHLQPAPPKEPKPVRAGTRHIQATPRRSGKPTPDYPPRITQQKPTPTSPEIARKRGQKAPGVMPRRRGKPEDPGAKSSLGKTPGAPWTSRSKRSNLGKEPAGMERGGEGQPIRFKSKPLTTTEQYQEAGQKPSYTGKPAHRIPGTSTVVETRKQDQPLRRETAVVFRQNARQELNDLRAKHKAGELTDKEHAKMSRLWKMFIGGNPPQRK